ncbi:MAG: amino acid ABC transporter substrate-binding protein [Actinomycetaceae bacterium]|nr:amino acid ABC transporter substrate-binding protein [Arcanobacterium sp.]MDD7505070.1 amino acid ABC transporter substrate-binding protein [Actinomycetaceae bacterium]
MPIHAAKALKKIGAALAGAAMVLSLASCSGDADGTSAGPKAQGDKFTVGFDANFPPYGYKDGDDYVGFDLDLAAEVAQRQGWELVKQPIDWDSKDMELNSGTVDALWNGFTINGREDDYTWSAPYVDNSIVFVTAADAGIDTQADLAGKVVLVQADSSGLAALEADESKELVDSFAELTQVPDYNNAFMTLESGAADAIAVDVGVARYQLEQRGEGKFTIMEPPFHTEQYGIGFKKGNEALRDQVEESLAAMKEDGTFMKLAEKYGLEDAVITD